MTPRCELFESTLAEARSSRLNQPNFPPIKSIINQLEYLVAVCKNAASRDRLSDINIGLISAREIEGLDDALATKLHLCSAEVRAMK